MTGVQTCALPIYDKEEAWFDSYTVMLNGEEVGEGTFDVETVQLTLIKHFRMFRWMTSYDYAVDDINIISGSDSILYALAYNESPKPDNSGSEDDQQADAGEDKPKKDTAKKDTETTEAPAEEAAPAEEKGCGSFVSGSAVAMVAVIGACGAVALRKRED